jgi:hypothetical protein
MKFFFSCLVLSGLFIAACGGTSTTIPGGDGGGGDGATTGDGSTGTDAAADSPLGGCNAPPINLTFTGCPAKPTCGGMIADGDYYYTTGCIPDPWAQAKQACQQLQVSDEKGTVKACVSFKAGIVSRNVVSSYSATLMIPTVCLLGGSCMQLETGLKQYFTMVTCTTATLGCSCAVGSSYVGTGATTYTTANNQVTTGQNNVYDYCVGGNMLGLQFASGPNREAGTYSLTKQ